MISVIKITAPGKSYHFTIQEWIAMKRLSGFLKANKATIIKKSITDIDYIVMSEDEFNSLKLNQNDYELLAGKI